MNLISQSMTPSQRSLSDVQVPLRPRPLARSCAALALISAVSLLTLRAVQADEASSAIIGSGNEAVLSAQMMGRIKHLNATLGASFAEGAVLVEFDCAERDAQLNAAQADYLGARETHLAKLRLEGLGAASELEVTTAAAAASRAKAQVALISSQVAHCKVLAPFAGRVAKLRAKEAETVNAGQALLEIVNPTDLKATINAPASYLRWLRTGSVVNLKSSAGRSYPAHVVRVNSRIDGVSQTIEVEAALNKSSDLMPGAVLEARFPQAPK